MIEYSKMKDIKIYKQLTHVKLKDWRILTTEKSPKQIYDWLKDNAFIFIEWEMHSRYSIESAKAVDIDELEGFIWSQSKEVQEKLREKKDWLKREMWKEMNIQYAKNYVYNLLNSN